MSPFTRLTGLPVGRRGATHRQPPPRKISRAAAALLMAISLSGSAVVLSACNTTAGVGQDVSATGHAVTGAAERTKQAF